MENEGNIAENLASGSTVKRRKAAIAARKLLSIDFCCDLVSALELEKDSNHWKTKVEIIRTIGLSSCNGATEALEGIVYGDEVEHDLTKMEGSKALIRISRESLSDFSVVKELIDRGGYSAVEGILESLGYDKMILSPTQCEYVIDACWDFGNDRPKGLTDPRYGLAAACAGWDINVTEPFLRHCLSSNDIPLEYVAEAALQQKYVRLR